VEDWVTWGGRWGLGGGAWRENEDDLMGLPLKYYAFMMEFKFLLWFHTKLLSSNKGSFAPLPLVG
jgi:hypothetical protein